MIDAEFENQALAKSLRDVSYLKTASKILESHHFSTPQHSWVWSAIKEVWDNYKELCSVKLLIAKVKRDFKEEDRESYLVLSSKLFRLKPDGAVAALEELTRFVRLTNAQLALEKAAKALEKGKIDDVYEAMRAVSQRDLKRQIYTHEMWIENFEKRQIERKYRSEHPEEFVAIPTGIKKLDSILSGGVQFGELALIVATTGRGKSIWLNNIAFNAVKHGYETLFFSFEMPVRQVMMRQDARWLKIDYKKFKNYDFTDDELKLIKLKLKRIEKIYSEKLHVVSMPVRGATMNDCRAVIDDLASDYGFHPKMIIFDSVDHLMPVRRAESHRLEQAENYWMAKGLAEELGAGMWSSTQAGKEFAKKTAGAEAPSESYDKARIADLLGSLNEPSATSRTTKPPAEKDDDGEWDDSMETGGMFPEVMARGKQLDFHLGKYRDGESKITIPLDAQFSKMFISELGEGDD